MPSCKICRYLPSVRKHFRKKNVHEIKGLPNVKLKGPRDAMDDKGFILKTDYCFLTTQCLAFNPMNYAG